MTPSARRPTGAGRPRDPDVDARVLAAAIAVYAAQGWAGFSFEEVARSAGAGKSSLYRRWPTRIALLLDAVRVHAVPIEVEDSGDLERDLASLARQTFLALRGEYGLVTLRLLVESRFYDDLLGGLAAASYQDQVRAARAVVAGAHERGELPEWVTPATVADLVVGAVLNRVLVTPPHLVEAMAAQAERFGTEVVRVVLAGVRSGQAPVVG